MKHPIPVTLSESSLQTSSMRAKPMPESSPAPALGEGSYPAERVR